MSACILLSMADPQDAPDFWATDLRRITAADGEEMILLIDQDGEVFLMNAEDYDTHPIAGGFVRNAWMYASWPEEHGDA